MSGRAEGRLVFTCAVGDDARVTTEALESGQRAIRLWFWPVTVLIASPEDEADLKTTAAWFRELGRAADQVADEVLAAGQNLGELRLLPTRAASETGGEGGDR
jgi:hypothetical protein